MGVEVDLASTCFVIKKQFENWEKRNAKYTELIQARKERWVINKVHSDLKMAKNGGGDVVVVVPPRLPSNGDLVVPPPSNGDLVLPSNINSYSYFCPESSKPIIGGDKIPHLSKSQIHLSSTSSTPMLLYPGYNKFKKFESFLGISKSSKSSKFEEMFPTTSTSEFQTENPTAILDKIPISQLAKSIDILGPRFAYRKQFLRPNPRVAIFGEGDEEGYLGGGISGFSGVSGGGISGVPGGGISGVSGVPGVSGGGISGVSGVPGGGISKKKTVSEKQLLREEKQQLERSQVSETMGLVKEWSKKRWEKEFKARSSYLTQMQKTKEREAKEKLSLH